MNNPAITVLMPVYNAETYLREAIDSILTQHFSDFEFLIIDDGSLDGSPGIIASYDDKRIRFIQNTRNLGLINTLNTGIGMARGKYIARMDADDISHQDRLSIQFGFMEKHREVILCGTWFEIIPSNHIIRHPVSHAGIKSAMLDHCALGHPTTMFRAEVMNEASFRYDESFVAAEDYELWTRMVAVGKAANVPQVLLRYREHETQVSARMRDLQSVNAGRCRINMLCLPLAVVTEEDRRYASSVLGLHRIVSFTDLEEALIWLGKLSGSNRTRTVFEDFDAYATSRKIVLTETFFYRYTNRYTPVLFYRFFKLCRQYRIHAASADQARLLLKCLCFYRKR